MTTIFGGLTRLRSRRLRLGRRILLKFDYFATRWRIFIGFALLFILSLLVALYVRPLDVKIVENGNTTMRLHRNRNGHFNILLERRGQSQVISVIGRHTTSIKNVLRDQGTDILIEFTDDVSVLISVEELKGERSGLVINVAWNAPRNRKLVDCVNFNSAHWYGGPEQSRQFWPIEKLDLSNYSYITKNDDKCAIAEPYWLSSEGIFYYFDKAPLFVDQNHLENRAACFIAEVKPPYSKTRARNDLVYFIGIFDDVRKAHEYAVEKYLKKPSGYPDERMITHPIWSTWARYKKAINHIVVMNFTDEILKHGFQNSQLEIDDDWETCYGSLTVNSQKFPNMKNTVKMLKDKGFRVTIWVHPFLNEGCEPWYSEADTKGYVVESESGSKEIFWWNGDASLIDFTKSQASKWYTDRIQNLKDVYGMDGFKFDAGETSWLPQIPVLQSDIKDHPGSFTSAFVRSVATFGPLTEVRVGLRTQDLPIFVRMIDKDSNWSFNSGLPTLVTTLLQMNINGYPLVLPDMIGGNGYDGPPSKELFIRWMQANVFMPSMQFSYVPWDFDNETLSISKKLMELRATYAPRILGACKKAVEDGTPINPPVWWIAPNDVNTYYIWDEYLLGETILVAPVLEQSAVVRDVYLPAGTWLEAGDAGRPVRGGNWIRRYHAPLDTLPFFVLK